ncbi:hypothetical protein SRB5_01670 [Streptomyces sp. RB5]|uniref:Uncharacterized protein n=1 Tax=Streptomyces smaragdinus TaxID=2585196 RepID=A0A7K0C9J8_9ACTN|nr:hypothetical protein [Streptomyces smaragdinus]
MGSDGYRVTAGMTGQAQTLDGAGTDMDNVGSAVEARTKYSYKQTGSKDAAAALNAFTEAWEAETKTLAAALHELGGKVQLARNSYRRTDGGVKHQVERVGVEAASAHPASALSDL